MTDAAFLHELRKVTDYDSVPALAALIKHLGATYPGDDEAEVIARHAELKRRRLVKGG